MGSFSVIQVQLEGDWQKPLLIVKSNTLAVIVEADYKCLCGIFAYCSQHLVGYTSYLFISKVKCVMSSAEYKSITSSLTSLLQNTLETNWVAWPTSQGFPAQAHSSSSKPITLRILHALSSLEHFPTIVLHLKCFLNTIKPTMIISSKIGYRIVMDTVTQPKIIALYELRLPATELYIMFLSRSHIMTFMLLYLCW